MTERLQVEDRTDDPAAEGSPVEDVVERQTIPQPAADEPAGTAAEGRAASGSPVDLDDAEQQVADWRREDEALLGEAPELEPASAEGQAAPAASAGEEELAAAREEVEALLGESLEATPEPATNESQM